MRFEKIPLCRDDKVVGLLAIGTDVGETQALEAQLAAETARADEAQRITQAMIHNSESPRILSVEDNPIAQKAALLQLGRHSYLVDTAASGKNDS